MECQSVEEAFEACAAGAEIVMLDNFTSDRIGAAAQQVKDTYPHVLVEASGVSKEYFNCQCIHILNEQDYSELIYFGNFVQI